MTFPISVLILNRDIPDTLHRSRGIFDFGVFDQIQRRIHLTEMIQNLSQMILSKLIVIGLLKLRSLQTFQRIIDGMSFHLNFRNLIFLFLLDDLLQRNRTEFDFLVLGFQKFVPFLRCNRTSLDLCFHQQIYFIRRELCILSHGIGENSRFYIWIAPNFRWSRRRMCF